MSGILSFKTMPVSSPWSYPKRIAVVGDLGLTYNTTSTIDHLRSNEPSLILLAGDVTYANLYLTNGTGSDCYSCAFPDTPIHETYQPRWDYWGRWKFQPFFYFFRLITPFFVISTGCSFLIEWISACGSGFIKTTLLLQKILHVTSKSVDIIIHHIY